MCTSFRSDTQDLARYKAIFIDKFINYIEWPAGNDALVIGIMGDQALYDELLQIKKSRQKSYEVIVLNATTLSTCDLIFVAGDAEDQLRQVDAQTQGQPVLIIGDTEAAASQGACISFFLADNKLRFAVNRQAASARGLNIAGALLSMAKVL